MLAPPALRALAAAPVLAEAPGGAPPTAAASRLDRGPGQKNALLRLTPRHLGGALTDPEAKPAARDRAYAALHPAAPGSGPAARPPPGDRP